MLLSTDDFQVSNECPDAWKTASRTKPSRQLPGTSATRTPMPMAIGASHAHLHPAARALQVESDRIVLIATHF
jgi:hypothetical protein